MKKSRKNRIERSAASSSKAAGPDRAGRVVPYVVGMGGSAGGLEAFGQFFSHLPADTGLAFVLVPHLEPTHKGMMPELLGRHTKMKVVEVEDGMEVQPNCVCVIPPNADLAILHGKLQVLEPAAPRGLRMPIDFFLRQLAADQKERAIGIILSGMGSDGTLGLKAIKENLGMAMVQDPASAKYDGMPRSAINTGLVDYVAAAEELPAKLIQYVNHSPQPPEDRDLPEGESSDAIQKVFVLLRAHTGNDFSCYKNNTISRRIERRMSVHQFDSLPRYVRFLQENPQEVELLYKELLIGVTNFFRDSGLFDFLKNKAIPQLFQDRPKDGPVRVWNPGCSTGEETYSLAIVLKECLEDLRLQKSPKIQVFATDIDKDAVEKARQGTFSSGLICVKYPPVAAAAAFIRARFHRLPTPTPTYFAPSGSIFTSASCERSPRIGVPAPTWTMWTFSAPLARALMSRHSSVLWWACGPCTMQPLSAPGLSAAGGTAAPVSCSEEATVRPAC